MLTAPLLLVLAAGVLRGVHPFGVNIALADVLPRDADVHLTCAWATGALMSFLADSYRRRGALRARRRLGRPVPIGGDVHAPAHAPRRTPGERRRRERSRLLSAACSAGKRARLPCATAGNALPCVGRPGAEWAPRGAARRQMFANAQLARAAAEKEIEEARARTAAQRALAGAQAQAAQRALTVAREKAANEAKSEFMSLMCHEARRPAGAGRYM